LFEFFFNSGDGFGDSFFIGVESHGEDAGEEFGVGIGEAKA